MILLQNPNIPNPTDPVEIDRAIQDLQMKLANSLVWLTQAYPRAYPQIESTQKAPFIFPAVYLGKANNDYKYLNAAPDNDKKAQCFFLVDTETVNDFVRGEHNILSYKLSIVFTANLKLVNDTTLATEVFQANLIQQVREVLTREITLTPYDLVINEVKLLFRDVYKEFQLQNAAVLEKAPFTHFRFECDLTLQEECNTPILNRCDSIKNHLTEDDLLYCILPTYNFALTATQNALSVRQVLDLKTWLLPQYDFSDTVWQNLLTTQQKTDLVNYLLPSVDFTDVAIQAIITPQQQSDLIAWLLPLVDFSDPAIQAIVTPTQQNDLSNWLCSSPPVVTQYSMLFDGVNEYITSVSLIDPIFTGATPFSISSWVRSTNYGIGLNQTVFSKRANVNSPGYSTHFLNGDFYVDISFSTANAILVKTNGFAFTNGNWYNVAFSYDGSQSASGVIIYVNGGSVATTIVTDSLTISISNGSAPVIGAHFGSGAFFSGNIGVIRIWNIALSPSEMTTDYNSGAMLSDPILLGNLVFGWRAGIGALFNVLWIFPNEVPIFDNNLMVSQNMEYIDKTTTIPI